MMLHPPPPSSARGDGRARNVRLSFFLAALVFIASALLSTAAAATSSESASPGNSDFYENLNVDTVDDTDEIIGSDGTLRETSSDIHDILELIEDGEIYPVLSKDDSHSTPFNSLSKDEDISAAPEVRDEFDRDASMKYFMENEESENKRRKRDDKQNNDSLTKENDKKLVKKYKGLTKPIFNKIDIVIANSTDINKKPKDVATKQYKPLSIDTINKILNISTKSEIKNASAPTDPINDGVNIYNNEFQKGETQSKSDYLKEKNATIDHKLENSEKPILPSPRVCENERIKRETSNGNKTAKVEVKVKEKRIKTGDTILNIKGAIMDSIGDATPGRSSGASVLDAVVIHPSQYLHDAPQTENDTEHTTRESATSTTAGSVGRRQLLAEHRSRVRLHCDLPANISVLEWVKDGELQIVAPGAGFDQPVWWAEDGAAIVGRAGRGEAGAWRCAGFNSDGEKVLGEPLHLTVYEESRPPYLELDGRRLDPGNTWVPLREGVVLEVTCISDGGVPAPELTWRLVGAASSSPTELRRHLRASPANYSQPGVTSSVARVTVTRALHNASLECDATQPRPEPRHPHTATARLLIHVTYPPSFVISRWPGFGVALWSGGRAALRCDAEANPPVRAWWTRETPDSPAGSPPPVDPPGAEPHVATLGWPVLALADAGWYRCRARWGDQEYSSIGYYLSVRPASEQPPSSSESPTAPQNVEVPLGGSVQMHCPKGTVGCWSRRVLGINGTETWLPAGSARAHGVLGIRGALHQEGGEYRCMGARAEDEQRLWELEQRSCRIRGALHQEGGEYRCVGARAEDEQRLRELKRVTLTVVGGATAAAASTSALPGGGWLLSCAVCGRAVRVRWLLDSTAGVAVVHPGQVTELARASPLEPDPAAPACARALLELPGGGEVWCAVTGAGGGAVAVFPPRGATPHHPPRALATAAATRILRPPLALVLLLICNVI